MALYPQESAILDLYDAGLSKPAIVAHGFAPSLVDTVCDHLGTRSLDQQDRLHRQRMRDASAQMVRAIQQARAA